MHDHIFVNKADKYFIVKLHFLQKEAYTNLPDFLIFLSLNVILPVSVDQRVKDSQVNGVKPMEIEMVMKMLQVRRMLCKG